MKVSVILPNYNHASFLRQRIESILAQTYTDFELVILDDCSTDNSVDIINTFRSNPHVRDVVCAERNSGSPFLQWEKGLSLCGGEYIWIAESDDYCTPDFLQNCIDALERFPQAALCHTGSLMVDGEGKDTGRSYDPWREDGEVRVFGSAEYINHNMLFWNECYNASKVVFRRSAYEKISKRFTTYRCAGDWLFMVSLMLQGDIVVIHKKLNRYRQHSDNVTVKSENDGSWIHDKIQLYADICKIAPVSPVNRRLLAGLLYKYICRLNADDETRRSLMLTAKRLMGAGRRHYLFERAVKTLSNFLPSLPEGKKYYRI